MNETFLPAVFDETVEEKQVFIKKTYSHVAMSLLAFVFAETLLLKIVPESVIAGMMGSKLIWLAIIGGFWLLSTIATKYSFSLDRNQQYMGLGLYILIESIIFLPMMYMVMYLIDDGTTVLMQAGLTTLFLFTGLTAVAFFSKKDFSFLQTGIIVGGFVSLGIIVVGALFGFNLGLWFSVGMCLLAGASILYQTSKILYDYNKEQYVGASLALFSSIMLLFWYILRIFMSRK
jgi:hypothetical protein